MAILSLFDVEIIDDTPTSVPLGSCACWLSDDLVMCWPEYGDFKRKELVGRHIYVGDYRIIYLELPMAVTAIRLGGCCRVNRIHVVFMLLHEH
jgi:hypothetical protein